jgi:hypothetical protein
MWLQHIGKGSKRGVKYDEGRWDKLHMKGEGLFSGGFCP